MGYRKDNMERPAYSPKPQVPVMVLVKPQPKESK